MTPFWKVMHALGYKPAECWDDEIETVARDAALKLGRARVDWIAEADKRFVFDDDEDTSAILRMTSDPVIWAAYGWHRTEPLRFFPVSKRVPKLKTKIMKAAHVWYCLRTTKPTRREELEVERRCRRRRR